MSYISFDLTYKYHLKILLEDKIDPRLKSYYANELVEKLKKQIEICYQNLFYIQEL